MHTTFRAPAGARLSLFATAILASLGLIPLQARADDTQAIENPPLLNAISAAVETRQLLKAPAGKLNLMALPRQNEIAPGVAGEVYFNLNIEYHNGWIRNPNAEDAKDGKFKYDKVQLRSYVQGDGGKAHSIDPSSDWGPRQATAYIAPEIQAYPGQTVRITLNNDLPQDQTCIAAGGSANTPHCFNGTNLHSHGLWVSPAGNSDNVMTSVSPGVGFQYEYNIPPTHPAGTFWYHPHQHGSTALQVSSGMAGALIVRGVRKPTLDENGDVDTLLKDAGGKTFPERVMVFQQIQYACRFPSPFPQHPELAGKIKTYANDPILGGTRDPNDTRYKCTDSDVGKIEGYDQFGPGGWAGSGRYTSINGVVLGKLAHAKGGTIERWRMIHAGVRDTINLKVRQLVKDAPPAIGLSALATENYIEKYCTGPDLPVPLIAADGLTMARVQVRKNAVFQPGYRWDALMVFPKRGQYCIINDLKLSDSTVDGVKATRLIGLVEVDSDADTKLDLASKEGVAAYLKDKLAAAARENLGGVPEVARDIEKDLSLAKFVPHQTIADNEVTGHQDLVFNIDTSLPGATLFQVNKRPYDGNRIDRTLPLGGTDEWTLTSTFVSHPFHIHVNPFQIVEIRTPDGKTDVSKPDAKDPDGDDEYAGLQGVWKDTIWVKNDTTKPEGAYKIVMRTRYERYIGDFVLHCHILDHEDQGMMQNVRIAVPDGHGGTAQAHH
ncbi:MAG TPA: multicopper oxidase domain-containing protein [Burkholderiaceae bacterium]